VRNIPAFGHYAEIKSVTFKEPFRSMGFSKIAVDTKARK
jgi:hypothetical protein